MIGRQRELTEIDRLLDRAAAGTGGLLVLLGAPGSGRTTVAQAAAGRGRRRGFEVVRASVTGLGSGLLVWAQVLRDLGDTGRPTDALSTEAGPMERDHAARWLASGTERLIVIDDLDRAGPSAIELLSVIASRLGGGSTAVVVTTGEPLGLPRELRLAGLTEDELAASVDGVPDVAGRALWQACGGLPGAARELADSLTGLAEGDDPVVHLALHAPSRAQFLDLDTGLVELLETACTRAAGDRTRARVLARLGSELLGDASAGERRRNLVDEALRLARNSGDPQTVAVVLDARLHAMWDPAGADDRLATATEIVALARAAADAAAQRRGLFWRFVALMELGQVATAESALAAFARAAETAGDSAAGAMVTSRYAMLAVLRGQFDQATGLIEQVLTEGRRAGLADTDRLVDSLRGAINAETGAPAERDAGIDRLLALSRRLPGHFFEATAARTLAERGRITEAGVELERLLPRLLAGSGPRWLGAVADLSVVAAATDNTAACALMHEALMPYQGKVVVWGGANTVTGPVCRYLGLLAHRLHRSTDAVAQLDRALAWEEETGALPGVARTLAIRAAALTARAGAGDLALAEADRRRARSIAERLGMRVLLDSLAPPADEWRLHRDGSDWMLEAAGERARLREARGLHYLRALLAAPGRDIAALDLAAGGVGLRSSHTGPVVDAVAREAYRARLVALDAQLDTADRIADPQLAEAATTERQAVLDELRRASGLGGRPRSMDAQAERARVNVTRTLRATIDRIAADAPSAAAHLGASLRTGRLCRYQPAPGGPARWQV
jgi:AAA ATPase-like protein